jgi:hypothetical protein
MAKKRKYNIYAVASAATKGKGEKEKERIVRGLKDNPQMTESPVNPKSGKIDATVVRKSHLMKFIEYVIG